MTEIENAVGFPPRLVLDRPVFNAEVADTAGDATKTKRLRMLAWALYTSGSVLETVEASLGTASLSKKAITAIDASIESYVDLVNAANSFLADYVNAVDTGKWPPIDIPLPPVIKPGQDKLSDIVNSIEGAVNTAIVQFQDSPNGAEVAHGLQALQKGLTDVVNTIKEYYPELFK